MHAPATAATVSSDPALYAALVADVDRYFSSDDHRTRARDVLAKQAAANGLGVGPKPPSPTVTHGPLHIVEFKACRTDVFYVAEGSGLRVQRGDLVIVEADRGRDLGKVVRADVGLAQVRALKAQQQREQAAALAGAGVVGQQGMGMGMGDEVNVQPKQIYRLAQPAEVAMLLAKSQDEAQAMLVCQSKVRQRKLPMEILDAEYQWDRRKLTFYFATNSIYRVDFRELVRDLFKVYKTRIWMCAVNPYAVE
ncbi:PSP1-domain-containing protein, partial [Saitoella complicata NRRL Y-17804]